MTCRKKVRSMRLLPTARIDSATSATMAAQWARYTASKHQHLTRWRALLCEANSRPRASSATLHKATPACIHEQTLEVVSCPTQLRHLVVSAC